MNRSGIINIYKEKGYTSHDVVNIVRGLAKCKAGHTGTLDPDAEGVLPVCLGRATKISDYIMADDKEYIANVILGTETTTQDASGEVLSQKPFLGNLFDVNDALQKFIGQVQQLPPMYSAIKVKGKKLYEHARQGEEVERKTRQITIHAIELLSADLPDFFRIKVACSKGTYIRALCADLGKALDSVAHMDELLRTRSGSFSVENAIKIDDLRDIAAYDELDRVIMPIEGALGHFPRIIISNKVEKWMRNGNKIPLEYVSGILCEKTSSYEEYLAHDQDGNLAGIYVQIGQEYIKPKVMLL
ncbi:MAG: tRNA pseudouridine(55) synthase TruB [Defluviitaleaceae bacterium]|nr:tRNA pseudouridine(55) synthase TruB [Defluviitaleaceae bacterium]